MSVKNRQGFIFAETLVITCFAIGMITFLYVSITPMIAKYEDMTYRESNIDIVYKLYHLRKMLYEEKKTFSDDFKEISCNDVANKDYCLTLFKMLDLKNYHFFFIKKTTDNSSLSSLSKDVQNYLKKNSDENILLLEDFDNHLIVHLKYQ